VTLINTDGMAFIGPGSEWFWAAAQFVVVVVTLYGIYRQLRSQGAANAVQRIETLEGEWKSPRMVYARLVLALHLKYESPNLDGLAKAAPLLNFFVNLANLNEAGYLSVEEIEANWGMQIPIWTALTAPLVDIQREIDRRPDIYDLDSLNKRLRALGRKKGVAPFPLDQEALGRMLDLAIANCTAALQREAAWQSGVIPTAPVPVDAA
jgi:hypothetical protein